MTTSGLEISPAVAGHFNTVFHVRSRLVQDRARAVLKAVLVRCAREGAAFEPEHLIFGVHAALERKEKDSGTNMVAYAFTTAANRQAKATEGAMENASAERRAEPLAPVGSPVVRVMGVPVAIAGGLGGFEEAVELAIAGASLTPLETERVRGTMIAIANGWKAMPREAVAAIASGLCAKVHEKGFNEMGWAVAEVDQLEAMGVNCSAPPTDRFLADVDEFTRHYRGCPEKARRRFMEAVNLLADSPRWVFASPGEQVAYTLRRLGTGIVRTTWGRWANTVVDAIRGHETTGANTPIVNPYNVIASAAHEEADRTWGKMASAVDRRFEAA